jgi:hypothetical protein
VFHCGGRGILGISVCIVSSVVVTTDKEGGKRTVGRGTLNIGSRAIIDLIRCQVNATVVRGSTSLSVLVCVCGVVGERRKIGGDDEFGLECGSAGSFHKTRSQEKGLEACFNQTTANPCLSLLCPIITTSRSSSY